MSIDCFVISVKHTQRRHRYITVWRPDNKGYAWPLVWAGRYSQEAVLGALDYYNTGCDSVVVPCEVLERLAVAPAPGEIDNNAGPVVRNTRENWQAILAAVIAPPRHTPQPEYKGARYRKKVAA